MRQAGNIKNGHDKLEKIKNHQTRGNTAMMAIEIAPTDRAD